MNVARHLHGLFKFDDKFYAFGGQNNKNRLRSAEFYEISIDTWTPTKNTMPLSGNRISCVRLGFNILITSRNFRCIRYNTVLDTYRVVGIRRDEPMYRTLVVSQDNVYFFEDN